jgi:hypothetical protein
LVLVLHIDTPSTRACLSDSPKTVNALAIQPENNNHRSIFFEFMFTVYRQQKIKLEAVPINLALPSLTLHQAREAYSVWLQPRLQLDRKSEFKTNMVKQYLNDIKNFAK